MVSHPSEQLPSEAPETVPTVMYLIEINSNVNPCSVRDELPLQMLNITQNDVHYLIPIQESDQTEIQKQIQQHEDLLRANIRNDNSNKNDLIKEQQLTQKIEQVQSYARPVQNYVHIPDSVPPPRAVLSLPSALRVRRGNVAPIKNLPPRVRFGPIKGVVQEVSDETVQSLISKAAASGKPILLVSNNDTISLIDVSDKENSNWFSLLPLGDERTANLWVYQEGPELFAETTRGVAAREPLRLGYSQRYAARLCLPAELPRCADDLEDEQHKWWCYECRFACKSAALLQRHTDETHTGCKSNTRRRRYRCKNCALPFSRLFTLRRHMSLHCKSKISKPEPQPEPETTPDVFLNQTPAEEERLPSDESFQNYTNSLDFSTNLFDTDRLSTLDISANSRSDLSFYGEKDDDLILQSDSIGDFVENAPSESDHVRTENLQKVTTTNLMTCPHCQDTISISLKNQHFRECSARAARSARGPARARLGRLQYDRAPGETDSSVTPIHQYKCDECQLNFKRRGMFVNHAWRVHGARARAPLSRARRLFPCVACPKLYRSAAKRAAHVRAHHPGAELMRAQTISRGAEPCAPAACAACPRQYATRAKMLQHVRAAHPHLAAAAAAARPAARKGSKKA